MTETIRQLEFPPDIEVTADRTKFIVRRRELSDYVATLDVAIARNSSPLPRALDIASTATGRGGWYGKVTVEQYRDMLEKGWPEALTGVEGLDGLCADSLDRLQIVRNVSGAFANVPAYVAGHPANMFELRAQQSEKRGVTLIFNACFDAGVDGETVLAYAVKVMKLVAWLQAQQIECGIYSVVCVCLDSHRYCYPIEIRAHGQVLQPERIAACLHPSWLRRAWFSMVEYDAYKGCKDAQTAYGYGTPRQGGADLYRQILPDAYSVVILPAPGQGDPEKAVIDALNLKLRREQ